MNCITNHFEHFIAQMDNVPRISMTFQWGIRGFPRNHGQQKKETEWKRKRCFIRAYLEKKKVFGVLLLTTSIEIAQWFLYNRFSHRISLNHQIYMNISTTKTKTTPCSFSPLRNTSLPQKKTNLGLTFPGLRLRTQSQTRKDESNRDLGKLHGWDLMRPWGPGSMDWRSTSEQFPPGEIKAKHKRIQRTS